MRIPTLLPLLAILTTLSICPTFGAAGLADGALALENSLGDLKGALAARGGFRFSGASKQIEHARQSASVLERRVASGGSREEVGGSISDLRGTIESMRVAVVQTNLSAGEHQVLRKVDARYGDVIRLFDKYRGESGRPLSMASAEPPEPSVPGRRPTPLQTVHPTPTPVPANMGHLSASDGVTKAAALHYLSAAYHVSERSIQVQDVLSLGSKHRVIAYVNGHLRAVDLDGMSRTISADYLVN